MKGMRSQLPLPNVTAEQWCVFDADTGSIIHGKHHDMRREVASLTKLMTFYASWVALQRDCPQHTAASLKIAVSKIYTKVNGTKANLKSGDVLTLEQLYYGMMLPSGNDAALVIANYFGSVIAEKKGDERP